MRALILSLVFLSFACGGAFAQACRIVNAKPVLAQVTEALKSGALKGKLLQGADAAAFLNEIGAKDMKAQAVFIDLRNADAPLIFVMIDTPQGTAVCFGSPTPHAREVILHKFGGTDI